MDANALEQVALNKVAEICQKKNIQMTPEKVGLKTEPFQSPPSWKASLKTKFDFILDRIKKQEDGMGRNLSHIFKTLPSKTDLPDYYKLIKRNVSTNEFLFKRSPLIIFSFTENVFKGKTQLGPTAEKLLFFRLRCSSLGVAV